MKEATDNRQAMSCDCGPIKISFLKQQPVYGYSFLTSAIKHVFSPKNKYTVLINNANLKYDSLSCFK